MEAYTKIGVRKVKAKRTKMAPRGVSISSSLACFSLFLHTSCKSCKRRKSGDSTSSEPSLTVVGGGNDRWLEVRLKAARQRVDVGGGLDAGGAWLFFGVVE